jgi:hypothetical protein
MHGSACWDRNPLNNVHLVLEEQSQYLNQILIIEVHYNSNVTNLRFLTRGTGPNLLILQ